VVDEERIAELLAAGDSRAAAEAVIRGYGPEILGYLTRVLRSADDAADALSFWAEDVWRGMGTFQGRSSVRVWSYRVAANSAARVAGEAWKRRRERMRTTMASRIAADVRSTTATSRDREAGELDRLRHSLSEEELQLLVLRVDRRLSWREVAEVLAREGDPVDEMAVRKRFERLKAKLGKLAKEKGLLR
jgi:RNA polymerase sigma-70 factor (ECF subfamily)